MVRVAGFEPAIFGSQSRRFSQTKPHPEMPVLGPRTDWSMRRPITSGPDGSARGMNAVPENYVRASKTREPIDALGIAGLGRDAPLSAVRQRAGQNGEAYAAQATPT